MQLMYCTKPLDLSMLTGLESLYLGIFFSPAVEKLDLSKNHLLKKLRIGHGIKTTPDLSNNVAFRSLI
jgi:hypothetical protein